MSVNELLSRHRSHLLKRFPQRTFLEAEFIGPGHRVATSAIRANPIQLHRATIATNFEHEAHHFRPLEADGAAAGLSAKRRRELDDIDPAWCPVWPVAWQHCFHLARTHVADGGTLVEDSGLLIIQGEDIGRWVRSQRTEWDALLPVQQWLLAESLGLGPLEEEKPAADRTEAVPRRSRAQMWAANLAAARQYAQREGHLNVPRSHIETLDGEQQALGVFIANSRARRASLAPERIEELTAIGMRWS